MIIGITGRVGSGKSFAAEIIAKNFQVKSIDLDEIGHEVLENPEIQEKLLKRFGYKILDFENKIDRKRLGALVFADKNALVRLNKIVHPEIKQAVLSLIKEYQDQHVIIIGALIKEIELEATCEKIVVLDAEDKELKKAVGIKFRRIAPFQRSRKEYLASANVIIRNHFDYKFEQDCIEVFKPFLD